MLRLAGSLAGYRVLVVEDDADSRDAIRLNLEASGASVATAASASEALAAPSRAASGSSPRSAISSRGATVGRRYTRPRRRLTAPRACHSARISPRKFQKSIVSDRLFRHHVRNVLIPGRHEV